jgi:hypothetical protein
LVTCRRHSSDRRHTDFHRPRALRLRRRTDVPGQGIAQALWRSGCLEGFQLQSVRIAATGRTLPLFEAYSSHDNVIHAERWYFIKWGVFKSRDRQLRPYRFSLRASLPSQFLHRTRPLRFQKSPHQSLR